MAGNIPITGLSQLGAVLADAGNDYANRKYKLEDEARLRAQRLEDVSSQRQYEQDNFSKIRNLQLSDEQRHRLEAIADVKTKAALEARFKMLNEAQARGLIDASGLGNQAAEDAAIQTVAQQLAKEAQFQQVQPANAASRLAELGQAEQQITQKMSAVEARLSSQPTVDQRAVQEAAYQVALQANGGKQPSRDQIMAAMPDAQAKIQQQAMVQWYQDKQDAQVQYQILSSQLNTIRQQQANLTSTFKVAPGPSPLVQAPSAPMAPTGAPAGASPIGGFLDALNKKNPPPAAPSNLALADVGAATRAAPPGAAPLLKQTGTSILADTYQKLDDPVNQTNAQLADVNNQIQRIQAGQNPTQGVTPSPLPQNPQVAGEYLTKLLQQQAALQRQLRDQQTARQQGKGAALSSLQINTPTQSAPVFQPSPGSILSDPYDGSF